MKNVCACPSGIAAAGRPVGQRFQNVFLGTVAVGALSFAIAGPAKAGPDACVTNGAVTTCSGNQSAGVAIVGPPLTTLNVNNLTTAIAPASGTSGISFNSGSGIAISSDTGAFGISTTGDNASGVFALSNGGGAVTVTSAGNISTKGSNAYGIYANSTGVSTGAVTVTSTGNITTAGTRAFGIIAGSSSNAITVTSIGNISITGNAGVGILALSIGAGAVTVTSTGNVTTTGSTNAYGITAVSLAGGTVTLTSTGNIATSGSRSYGIAAASLHGAVTVNSDGNITTAGNNSIGIHAYSSSGAVTVTSSGNITTQGSGASAIYARNSAGPLTVTSTGNITAAGNGASGIVAMSNGGPIMVTINSATVSGGSGSGGGVLISGGTTNTLTNFGTVTALSGLAIGGDTGNNTVNNFGTVTGNVILGSGTNAFNNRAGGLFNAGVTVNLGAGNALTNAGTLSPGGAGAIQTTALTGNLTQTTTGRLAVDFNIAAATLDRINLSGTANLAGSVQLQASNPQLGAFQQTFLSAAGGTTNNGLSLQASPALQAQLVYPNPDDVAIKSSGINFVTPGLNGNQTSLGNALNGAAQTAVLGGPIFNALLNGPTSLDGYRQVLNQLSGEGATGTQQATVDAMGQFVNLLLDPYSRGGASTPGGGVSGYASEADGRQRSAAERDAYAMFIKAPPPNFEARWTVWAAGFGGSQTTDGNTAAGSNSTTSHIAAGAVGADYRITPDTIAGFALAGGGTGFVMDNGLGTGRSDLFQAGAYVRHTIGPAYIAGALAYGWQDVTTNRSVTLAGLDQLQARFNANAFSGRLEGGYRFVSPWMGVGITPYAAGQFTTFDLPAYAEHAVIGTNNFALAYGAKDVTAPRSELGFRTDQSFVLVDTLPDTILTLRSRFAWAHDYSTDRSISATFQTLPGASFVVGGAAQSADKALTTAGAEVKWRNGFSLSGTFEGEFSSNSSSYAGKAVARYQW
jgi:uncharacterized protein with beta-barrel porin domain